MSDVAQQLEKIILKAGIDGALTEDAVAQFNALVKERDALKEKLAHEERIRKEEAEKASRYHNDLAAANQKLSEWADREQELKDREDKVLRVELTAEMHETRVADHKEMMRTVFKPYSMRKSLYENATEPGHDQYGGTVSTTKSKDTTIKEDED